MIKILNLYAGIGGNRKLWKDVEVTAVENNPEIAKIYQDFFPRDKVIIADAHQYLLDHYKEFDFIWSSPPCPTHSDMRRFCVQIERTQPKYPDMKLYEEIIFLSKFFDGKYVVENVIPYYEPLIKPQIVSRHCFWANFIIPKKKFPCSQLEFGNMEIWTKLTGFDISKYKLEERKDKIMKNCVNPELGLHVFNMAFKDQQKKLTANIPIFIQNPIPQQRGENTK